jgi:hypothetical protein
VSPRGPPRWVTVDEATGAKRKEADTLCERMLFGLLALGKVPTAWSGSPLADKMRAVVLQLQLAVLVAFTEGELLKAL